MRKLFGLVRLMGILSLPSFLYGCANMPPEGTEIGITASSSMTVSIFGRSPIPGAIVLGPTIPIATDQQMLDLANTHCNKYGKDAVPASSERILGARVKVYNCLLQVQSRLPESPQLALNSRSHSDDIPPASSSTKTNFPTSPVVVRFARVSPRPDDIAVIIGNADYGMGKDIPNVTPAYADAAGIKKYVKQSLGIRDENIIFLKDASQAALTATFGSESNPKGQLFNYVKPGKSRVFVYYSGHGAPSSNDGSSYLVPSNAQASLIDLNGYALKTLYKNLSKIPAKSMTVVLEACFSGASQSGTVIAKASPILLQVKETGVPSNITVISAGMANQIASWEEDSSSGLFTKYFLKGMSGEADAKPYGNGDGKVAYDELDRYLKETMTYYARRYYGREQTAQIVVGEAK